MHYVLKLLLATAFVTLTPGCGTLIDVAFDAALPKKKHRVRHEDRCDDPPRRRRGARKVVYVVECGCHGPCHHHG